MAPIAQRFLGIAVWRLGRWYLRRHTPRAGLAAAGGLAGLVALAALAAAARRLSA